MIVEIASCVACQTHLWTESKEFRSESSKLAPLRGIASQQVSDDKVLHGVDTLADRAGGGAESLQAGCERLKYAGLDGEEVEFAFAPDEN